jgi:hypothetical protein
MFKILSGMTDLEGEWKTKALPRIYRPENVVKTSGKM